MRYHKKPDGRNLKYCFLLQFSFLQDPYYEIPNFNEIYQLSIDIPWSECSHLFITILYLPQTENEHVPQCIG